jgi:hypothetical protein
MPAPKPKSDVFYLGFNKNTGELMEVVPPNKMELQLDPKQVHELGLGLLDPDTAKLVLRQLKNFYGLMKENALPTTTLTFLDNPERSVCGGSVGGVPFKFC